MYGKQEAQEKRKAFWTKYGKLMKPIVSQRGRKVNWVNYESGVKGIKFRTEWVKNTVQISIDIDHSDPDIQYLHWEQLWESFGILKQLMGEENLTFEREYYGVYDFPIGRIYRTEEVGSIYNEDSWPQAFQFYKTNIIQLDEYWSMIEHLFDDLKA